MEASLLRLVEGVEGHTQTFRSLHPKVCEVPYSSISKLQVGQSIMLFFVHHAMALYWHYLTHDVAIICTKKRHY